MFYTQCKKRIPQGILLNKIYCLYNAELFFLSIFLSGYKNRNLLISNTYNFSAEYKNSNSSASVHFVCGLLAGLLASCVTQPADVIKTRMQLYPREFRTFYSSLISIYHQYGLYGYFKGIVPRMLRRTLMSAMTWTIYEEV